MFRSSTVRHCALARATPDPPQASRTRSQALRLLPKTIAMTLPPTPSALCLLNLATPPVPPPLQPHSCSNLARQWHGFTRHPPHKSASTGPCSLPLSRRRPTSRPWQTCNMAARRVVDGLCLWLPAVISRVSWCRCAGQTREMSRTRRRWERRRSQSPSQRQRCSGIKRSTDIRVSSFVLV